MAWVRRRSRAGREIIEIPRADDCPLAVFVEDTVVLHGAVAVISRVRTRFRIPSRRAQHGVAHDGFGWVTACPSRKIVNPVTPMLSIAAQSHNSFARSHGERRLPLRRACDGEIRGCGQRPAAGRHIR